MRRASECDAPSETQHLNKQGGFKVLAFLEMFVISREKKNDLISKEQ